VKLATVEAPAAKGLAENKLGLWDSVFIGVSSTAPAYSVAATLGFIVLAAGNKAPLALVLAFLPMFLVAIAYRELNKVDPDCGTTFTWAKKAFGEKIGWIGGWALALSGGVVLANLAQVAGQYFWILVNEPVAENKFAVAAAGLAFIAAMTWVSFRGIEVGAKLQQAFLFVQYAALAIFAGAALFKLNSAGATEPFSWSWFSPAGIEPLALLYGVLMGLFIYWGWDSCLALNEETKDPTRIPGRAALISSVMLLVTYVGVAVLMLMVFGAGAEGTGLGNAENAADVLHATSTFLLGETTILPTARGTLSMATQGALPAKFGKVHPKYRTPSYSTSVMGALAAVYFVVMSLVSDNFLQDSIAAISLFIAFYYAVTAAACAWTFRKAAAGFKQRMNTVILPAIGAVAMAVAFVASSIDMVNPDYGQTEIFGLGGAFVIGIGLIALGFPLMSIWFRARQK